MTPRWVWLPLALFVAFAGLAAWRLSVPGSSTHRSALIGKPIPAVTLAAAVAGKPGVATVEASGGPRLVNVFASWCIPCASEAPVLAELRARGAVIDAIAIRDRREDVAAFLERYGDPYRGIGLDPRSQVQMALGSSGVPETFVVDSHGTIHDQYIGELRPSDIEAVMTALSAAR